MAVSFEGAETAATQRTLISGQTSFTVSMPTTVNANDIIVVGVAGVRSIFGGGAGQLVNTPFDLTSLGYSGWYSVAPALSTSASIVFVKNGVGTEGGTTVTLPCANPGATTYICALAAAVIPDANVSFSTLTYDTQIGGSSSDFVLASATSSFFSFAAAASGHQLIDLQPNGTSTTTTAADGGTWAACGLWTVPGPTTVITAGDSSTGIAWNFIGIPTPESAHGPAAKIAKLSVKSLPYDVNTGMLRDIE